MMQTQTNFCLCFTKINIKLFSGAPKVPLISQVSLSPKIKKSFLGVSVWDYQPLKYYTFLAKSPLKLNELFQSNATPEPNQTIP